MSALNIKDRILNAVIARIEGVKEDIKRRLDYLTNPDNIKTMSRLTEEQVQAVNECCWLAENFPEFNGLKQLALGMANWRISLDGKGREEAVSTMMTAAKRESLEGLGIHLHPEIKTESKEEKKK